MATSPLSSEEVIIKTLLRIEMPQHSELHAWCDGKLTPSSGTHKSNCDLVNELLVTSEKAASFLLDAWPWALCCFYYCVCPSGIREGDTAFLKERNI